MQRSRTVPIIIVLTALSLSMLGCGLGTATIDFDFDSLSQATSTPLARLVQRDSFGATPQADEPDESRAPRGTLPTDVTVAPAPVVINVDPSADYETQVLTAIYEKVNPSVVNIYNLAHAADLPTDLDAIPQGQGSGFVWDTQGHIVTNDHVVRDSEQLQVTFADGLPLEAELVGSDPHSDLAVIRVDPDLVTLVPVEQGDIDELQVGQRAIAIGNPFGFQGTMTEGIISAMGRSIPALTNFSIPEAIQTDAAINPGNSGGPLLNDRGQVIGVNAQISSDTRSNSGVGFAIPINIVQRVIPALIEDGEYRHSYLGVIGRTYSPEWAEALGFSTTDRGAYVDQVVEGGPAAQAGLQGGTRATNVLLGLDFSGPVYLQQGGDLIVGIEEERVNLFDDILIYLERYTSPGQVVNLTVLHANGSQETIAVELDARPEAEITLVP